MSYIGKQPSPAVLTASDITDGIVSNAKLAQDIISADTALGAEPADTDEFLVSDAGTLKRMDYSYIKSSPGLVLLTSGSTTSTTSSVIITGTQVTSTYDHYRLYLAGKSEADNKAIYLRYRNSSNDGTISSNYSYRVGSIADNGSGSNSTSASAVLLTQDNPGNAANEGFNLILDFMSPAATTVPTSVHWTMNLADNGDDFQALHGQARRNDGTEVHTGFTIYYASGGDFDSYNYAFYGLAKS